MVQFVFLRITNKQTNEVADCDRYPVPRTQECAKLRGLHAIVGLLGLVPLCHHAFIGISWVQNILLWVFCGFKIFSCGYFLSPKFYLLGILWVQDFSCWYFVGPKFCNFQLLATWEKCLKLLILFQIDFSNFDFC